MQKAKGTGLHKEGRKFGEESEEKEAYPMGGVWPSPFPTRFLLCTSLDIIIIITFILSNNRADENLAPFNITRKHKASFPIMDNFKLELGDEC